MNIVRRFGVRAALFQAYIHLGYYFLPKKEPPGCVYLNQNNN
jgi:hypothetical protein